MSPRAAAPSRASVIAWARASASEWPSRPWLCGMVMPPRTSGRPVTRAWVSQPSPMRKWEFADSKSSRQLSSPAMVTPHDPPCPAAVPAARHHRPPACAGGLSARTRCIGPAEDRPGAVRRRRAGSGPYRRAEGAAGVARAGRSGGGHQHGRGGRRRLCLGPQRRGPGGLRAPGRLGQHPGRPAAASRSELSPPRRGSAAALAPRARAEPPDRCQPAPIRRRQ